MTDKLPKFDKPPVIETVIGLHFKPIMAWQTPHFGLYWHRIRSNYPQSADQPPLPDEVERFGDERKQLTIRLGREEVRCWFIDQKGQWLLQIQNTRFISNWRRDPTGKYPSYRTFQEKFSKEWARFIDFLDNEKIEHPQLVQAEVSYVNHIDVDDLKDVVPVWAGFKKKDFLPIPEAVGVNTVYLMPEDRGRLYIAINPVIRHSDMRTVFQLTLTAKTLVASNGKKDMMDAIKIGHEWVVRGFADFTSPKMHEVWQRTQ